MNSYKEYQPLIDELRTQGSKAYKEWLTNNIIRIHKAILYDKKEISPLCVAVVCYNIDLISWFLKKGINKNGIIENGISYYTPLSMIYLIDIYFIKYIRKKPISSLLTNNDHEKLFSIKQSIFDLLILNGADINKIGLNGQNLLSLECSKPLVYINPQWIEYILSKGINPNKFHFISKSILASDNSSWLAYRKSNHIISSNGPIAWFFQPIFILFWSMVNSIILTNLHKFQSSTITPYLKLLSIPPNQIKWNKKSIKKISLKCFNHLIFHGANIKQNQSDNRNMEQIIEWIKNGKSVWHNKICECQSSLDFSYLIKKINRPIETILKNHAKSDIPKIIQLASFFKISTKTKNLEEKIIRKRVCHCIQFLKEDIVHHDFVCEFNKIKSINSNLSLTGESINKYSNDEIIIYKEQDKIYAFHISEIPYLIKTQINPYTRIKIPFQIIKSWYNILNQIHLPLTFTPLVLSDIRLSNFKETILSQNNLKIVQTRKINQFNFSNITDQTIRDIFIKNNNYTNMNLLVHNVIIDARKNKIPINNILSQKSNIIVEESVEKIPVIIEGFGIYKQLFNIKKILIQIEYLFNQTSIGCYVNLCSWLNSWSYTIIFKLFSLLLHYKQQIFNDTNWKFIMSIWNKRKSYARLNMKKFFIDLFIFIVWNGFHTNSLDITLLIGLIIQLHKENELIIKIRSLVFDKYTNIWDVFEKLENHDNKLIDSFTNEYLSEIIKLLYSDETIRDIFSLKKDDNKFLDITLAEDPALAYFQTTLSQETLHLANLYWEIMTDEEKKLYTTTADKIYTEMSTKINDTWKSIQDLLYLVNNEEFRESYLIV